MLCDKFTILQFFLFLFSFSFSKREKVGEDECNFAINFENLHTENENVNYVPSTKGFHPSYIVLNK